MPAAQSTGVYPFFFPTLFGNGSDGDLTLTTNSDVGYLGSYGAKQAVNATLAAGQTLTIGQGTSSGALIIACRGKLTIAGTITADGENGGNATAAGAASGAGGKTCGGGLGAASISGYGDGTIGSLPTKGGHGAVVGARGGSAGAHAGPTTPSAAGQGIDVPLISGTAVANQRRLIQPSSSIGGVMFDSSGIGVVNGSPSINGTNTPTNPSTNNLGPWAQTASGLYLHLGSVPCGAAGFAGGTSSDGSNNAAAGGGAGGGGGCIIFEANVIELVSGYSITARGGNGGNATVQGGTAKAVAGSGGWGGLVLMICRNLIGSTAAINCNGGSAGTSAGSGAAVGLAGVAGGFYVIKV